MRSLAYLLLPLVALAGCGQAKVASPVERGEEHYLSAEWAGAVAAANEALDLDPRNARAMALRGKAYLAQQNFDRAKSDLDQAIRLNPDAYEPYSYRAMVYRRRGDSRRALEDELKARSLNPAIERAYMHQRASGANAAARIVDEAQVAGAKQVRRQQIERERKIRKEFAEQLIDEKPFKPREPVLFSGPLLAPKGDKPAEDKTDAKDEPDKTAADDEVPNAAPRERQPATRGVARGAAAPAPEKPPQKLPAAVRPANIRPTGIVPPVRPDDADARPPATPRPTGIVPPKQRDDDAAAERSDARPTNTVAPREAVTDARAAGALPARLPNPFGVRSKPATTGLQSSLPARGVGAVSPPAAIRRPTTGIISGQ